MAINYVILILEQFYFIMHGQFRPFMALKFYFLFLTIFKF